jgi:hypothetical protein
MSQTRIYNEGFKAFARGIGREHRPHDLTGEQREAWEQGWDAAARMHGDHGRSAAGSSVRGASASQARG